MDESVKNHAILARLFALDGEVAVVAGGAGRIGGSLCRALAAAGAKVCVLDTRAGEAEMLADEIKRATGRETLALAADITDADALADAARRVTQGLGPAQVLVNCAQFRGTGFYSSCPESFPREAWDAVLATNLTGVFLACQEFGRIMIEHSKNFRNGGRIINLASTYGVVSPDPRVYGDSGVNSPPAYGASKAAVIQLTRYLAVHWREHNIRVNCLVPGGVFDNQDEQFVSEYRRRTPLNRMARPEDYQGAVLFMASAASAYMTGTAITVDGGWTAW